MARSGSALGWTPLRRAIGGGMVVLGLGGCGGAATTDPALPIARPVAADRVASPVIDGDASQPRHLAVVMRLRNPEDTVDAASFVSGTPLSILLAVASHVEEAKALATLDLEQPIDAALVVPPGVALGDDEDTAAPDPLGAVTFGVSRVDRFMAALPRSATVSRPRSDGTVRVSVEGVVCAVPDVGGSAARVLCGSSEQALRELGPWMTRTLSGQPLPTIDAHFAFHAAPVREAVRALVTRELREEAASARNELEALGVADPELLALPTVVLDEMEALAEDSDRIDLELDVDQKARTASAKLVARFRGTSAWVTRVLADPADRRGKPPAIFWRAPRDADAASWALASSPRHFAGMRRVLSRALTTGMSRAGLSPDESSAIVGVFDGIPAYGGPWVSAQGQLPWKSPPRGKPTPQNAIADFKDRTRAFLGWGLVGVESPSTPWVAWAESIDRAWKKVTAGTLTRQMSADDRAAIPELKLIRGPQGYPRGSLAIDLVGRIDSEMAWETSPRRQRSAEGMMPPHPPGPPARGSMTLRVVIVPDGERTFIGWSLDDAALRSHLQAALRTAPESGTIAGRADLKRLDVPGTGGGFFSMKSWIDLSKDLVSEEVADEQEVAIFQQAIDRLPNQGATPILTFADGTAGSAPTLTFEVLLQEGTIDDLRALGQFAIGQGMRGILGGSSFDESTLGGPVMMTKPPTVAPPPPPP